MSTLGINAANVPGVGLTREKSAVDLLEHVAGGVHLEPHARPYEPEDDPLLESQHSEAMVGLEIVAETRVVVLYDR